MFIMKFAISWYTAWACVSHHRMIFAAPPSLLFFFLRNVIATGLILAPNGVYIRKEVLM